MANKPQADVEQTKKKKAPALSQSDLPSVSLAEALRVPVALRDSYNLNAATPLDVGFAIGIAPTSGSFRTLTGAAIAFGLTSGGYNASEIALTDLGRRIVAPTEEGDDRIAKLEAFEKPRLVREFLAKYNGGRLPNKQVAQNVLNGMGIAFEVTDRAYELLMAGLRDQGYIKEMNGAQFIQRPAGALDLPATPSSDDEHIAENGEVAQAPSAPEIASPNASVTPPPLLEPQPNAIFLGHGKNRQPLEQLIKILDEYGIPHKEAIAEPNAGRPIPTKVADTMRQCGAAILIFTADEKFFDEDGQELWRPSENVVHELGAASMLYGNRIVIFKEDGVTLASNFSSIGYISFDKNKLSDKGIELFRELVSFKIVKFTVGG